MRLGEGVLEKDIVEIINAKSSGLSPENTTYTVYLHTTEIDMHVQLLESIEILRDYNVNVGDYFVINFKMGMGDFIYDIFPYRNNMEMTVIKRTETREVSLRYKFVLLNNKNLVNGDYYSKMSRDELNKAELINIEGQCLDRYVEVLRTVPVDGVYRFLTIEDLLIATSDTAIKSIIVGGSPLDVKIDCYKPHNQRVYEHVEVKTGVKVLDMPTYIQNTSYGVYNGAIGTYFQNYGPDLKETLFIYPLFDYKRFLEVDGKKLVIIKATTNRFDVVENTFMVDGDILKIIAGSKTKSINIGDDELMNTGGEIAAINPDLMLQRNAVVSDGGVHVSNTANMVGQTLKEREDGNKNVAYVGPTDNLYKYRSNILRKTMTTYQFQWNYGNEDLIFPGMPVMYVHEDDGVIYKAYGTVQSVYMKHVKPKKSFAILINILVIDEEEIPEEESK